ncbi:YoaK family protein [Massilia consociata]|uniref:YoaK family protein n=1 Tax=Massilia consociata TaxID=760117 RepID=A0ABV6FM29_9BURK
MIITGLGEGGAVFVRCEDSRITAAVQQHSGCRAPGAEYHAYRTVIMHDVSFCRAKRMPIQYLSGLTAQVRTGQADLHIGVILALVAGALNAGGFLAIGQYTSHMTGMVSAVADHIVLRNFALAGIAAIAWIAFLAGAAFTALIVNYLRRADVRHPYAVPLLLEVSLILLFGAFGATLEKHEALDVSLAVTTLCFTMGLQNALITKISQAEIRTTHVTGLTTDLGIEIGKLLYWNGKRPDDKRVPVLANRNKLRVHAMLIASFLVGGSAGALGFHYAGFIFTVPLALALAVIAVAPAVGSVRSK